MEYWIYNAKGTLIAIAASETELQEIMVQLPKRRKYRIEEKKVVDM